MHSQKEFSQPGSSAGKQNKNFFLYERSADPNRVPNSPRSQQKSHSEQGMLPKFANTQQNFKSGRQAQGFRQGEYFRSTLADSTKRQLEVIAAHGLPNLKSSLSSALNSDASDQGQKEYDAPADQGSLFQTTDVQMFKKHRSIPHVVLDASRSEFPRETDLSSGGMQAASRTETSQKVLGQRSRSKQMIETLSTTLHLRSKVEYEHVTPYTAKENRSSEHMPKQQVVNSTSKLPSKLVFEKINSSNSGQLRYQTLPRDSKPQLTSPHPEHTITEFYLEGLIRLRGNKNNPRQSNSVLLNETSLNKSLYRNTSDAVVWDLGSQDHMKSQGNTTNADYTNELVSPSKSLPRSQMPNQGKKTQSIAELTKFEGFYMRLESSVREYFKFNRPFLKNFKDLDRSFVHAEQIMQRVQAYKPELGYQFETALAAIYSTCLELAKRLKRESEDREKDLELRMKFNFETMNQLEGDKMALVEQIKQYQTLLKTKTAQFEWFEMKVKALTDENKFLNDWIKKNAEIMNGPQTDYFMKENSANARYGEVYAHVASMKDHVESLNSTISAMEKQHREKYQVSNEFEKTLREMLKAQKHDQTTQVYEHELAWDGSQLAQRQRVDNLSVGTQNTVDMGVNIFNKEYLDEYAKKSDPLTRSKGLSLKQGAQGIDEPFPLDGVRGSAGSRPNLDLPGSGILEEGQTQPNRAFQLEFGLLKNFTWQMPPSTVVFLKNSIDSKETVLIRPWMAVRRDIDEFYAFLLSASEVEPIRFVATTSTEDLLILFFLHKHKLRRLAEKRLMEFVVSLKYYCKQKTKAINCALVCSLVTAEDGRTRRTSSIPDFDMYFQGYFLFILKSIDELSGKVVVAQEDTSYIEASQAIKISEEVLKYFDSEVRESFLSRLRNCISAFNNEDLVALKSQMLAQQGTANQAGSSGGNFSSLVNVFNHQMVQQFNAFQAGNSLTNLATTTPVTGPLSIDLDKLVYVLLEEYLSAKRKNELTFVEDFLKKLKSDKVPVSSEDALTVCSGILKRKEEFQESGQGSIFPGSLTILKGLLYGITSGENSQFAQIDKVLEGMNKFGLMSPFPPLYPRLLVNNQGKLEPPSPNHSRKPSGVEKLGASPKVPSRLLNEPSRTQPITRSPKAQNSVNPSPANRAANQEAKATVMLKPSINIQQPAAKTKPEDQSKDQSPRDHKLVRGGDGYLKLDRTAALFAQHYSIIREVKHYVEDFRGVINGESDIKEVWKCFENLATLLESASSFLSFPTQL